MDEHAPDRRGRARGKRAGPAPALPLVAGLTPSAPAEHHPQHHPPAPPPSSAKWLISESKTTTSQSSMGHVAHGQVRKLDGAWAGTQARWGMGEHAEPGRGDAEHIRIAIVGPVGNSERLRPVDQDEMLAE